MTYDPADRNEVVCRNCGDYLAQMWAGDFICVRCEAEEEDEENRPPATADDLDELDAEGRMLGTDTGEQPC